MISDVTGGNMLIPISELPTEDERIYAWMAGWTAVDPISGAMLSRSNGRSSKAPKYILILPNKSVEERGGLFTKHDWDYPQGRKFVRAWSGAEAIELANAKLAKMLEQRAAA